MKYEYIQEAARDAREMERRSILADDDEQDEQDEVEPLEPDR